MSHSMPESPPPSFDRTSLRKVTGVQFLLRGLAISLPPILTVVILLWVGKGINDYLIHPTTTLVRYSIATLANQARPIDQFVTWDRLPAIDYCGRDYRITPDLKERLVQQYQSRADRKIDPDEFASAEADQIYVPMAQAAVPYTDFREVAARLRPLEMPTTAIGMYMELVATRYFRRLFHFSVVAHGLLVCEASDRFLLYREDCRLQSGRCGRVSTEGNLVAGVCHRGWNARHCRGCWRTNGHGSHSNLTDADDGIHDDDPPK